jgi:hypothetical protein
MLIHRPGRDMQNREPLNLHRRALQALEHSTKKLKVAAQLLRAGNYTEAARLQDEARTERNISVWLLAQAKNRARQGNDSNERSTGRLIRRSA